METSKDYEEFFRLLNENNVRYLVVGGYAFAVHARPRYTNDLDIWILSESENAERIVRTIGDFIGNDMGISIDDFIIPDKIIQIGFSPLRIDILTSIDGVEFPVAWEKKLESTYGDQKIYLIGKDDFIQNKRASGRNIDLMDLEELE